MHSARALEFVVIPGDNLVFLVKGGQQARLWALLRASLDAVLAVTRPAAVFGGLLMLEYQKSSAAKASHWARRMPYHCKVQ
ncbi:MAG: hypothetical protein PHH58_02785 [Rhodoferax sp.]|nr:hypothetical protein [Rhodoferax sp.]